MSHAEIWDDSALVNSWNEALEEYRHYHSIHARGEKVEEVLKIFDSGSHETTGLYDPARQERVEIPNGSKGGENEEGPVRSADGRESVRTQSENKPSQAEEAIKLKQSDGVPQGGSSPLLQRLIGSVHDEGLKNLLMSWYYAGYYTGLYEGQHQEK